MGHDMRPSRFLFVGGLVALAALLLATVPVMASDPPSHEVTAPTTDGETVTVEWTGLVPPGAELDSDCTGSAVADPHTIALTVPEGTYDTVNVRMTATVTPTGPNAPASDVIVTLVLPDGTSQSGDSGFVGAAESTGLSNPAGGTYEVLACPFAVATPQPYTGTLTLEASERAPATAGGLMCKPPKGTPKFESDYIDTDRAGGEPMIVTHPDGQLLWGSHAGTTHFYTPTVADEDSSAFVENYSGQTYQYVNDDGDDSWQFVERLGLSEDQVSPVEGIPATGFSDPEFAIDQAGNVFISEINLANVAVSKSSDGGHSYGLQNVFSFTMSDRQWMAADRADELYMAASGFGGGAFGPHEGVVGELDHFLAKSTDGGVTWNEPFTIDPIVGDLQIDHDRGILYSLFEQDGTLSMARFPDIRQQDTDFTVEVFPIASDIGLSGVQRLIDPTFDLDGEGNLYATWSDNGSGLRPQGIYYAYSTDQGETWSLPHRVDPSAEADVWPWITVGERGQVAVTWLQGDKVIEGTLPGEEGGDDTEWHVAVATSDSGLGCPRSSNAGFAVAQATPDPVHTGTICQHGTVCQTDLTDRRLGDYFSITAALDGTIHIAVSDTRQGGAVALPLHVRQVGGQDLSDTPPWQ